MALRYKCKRQSYDIYINPDAPGKIWRRFVVFHGIDSSHTNKTQKDVKKVLCVLHLSVYYQAIYNFAVSVFTHTHPKVAWVLSPRAFVCLPAPPPVCMTQFFNAIIREIFSNRFETQLVYSDKFDLAYYGSLFMHIIDQMLFWNFHLMCLIFTSIAFTIWCHYQSRRPRYLLALNVALINFEIIRKHLPLLKTSKYSQYQCN